MVVACDTYWGDVNGAAAAGLAARRVFAVEGWTEAGFEPARLTGFILEPVSWPVRFDDFDHTPTGEQGFFMGQLLPRGGGQTGRARASGKAFDSVHQRRATAGDEGAAVAGTGHRPGTCPLPKAAAAPGRLAVAADKS
ncbi:MAG: hypothetical protein NZ869_02925 [Thermoanaerobaculum sp.]|nr:hypothetical protein [Thermoanaerobaculum sp.]MDW7967570.1 hypothetical protein [Thermoanaerobaculum sp.]